MMVWLTGHSKLSIIIQQNIGREPTCGDVAVLSSILRCDHWPHISTAQGWEVTLLPVKLSNLFRAGHYLVTHSKIKKIKKTIQGILRHKNWSNTHRLYLSLRKDYIINWYPKLLNDSVFTHKLTTYGIIGSYSIIQWPYEITNAALLCFGCL